MIGEFFGWDEGKFGLRHMALIPFGIGLAILGYYYLVLARNPKFREDMQVKATQILKEEVAQHRN
jgi:hypothetical protein